MVAPSLGVWRRRRWTRGRGTRSWPRWRSWTRPPRCRPRGVDVVAVGRRAEPGRWSSAHVGGRPVRGVAVVRLLRESVSRETPDARGEQGARTVNLLKVPVPGLTEAGVGGRGEREADLPGHRDPARAGCGAGRGCGVAGARRRRPVDAEAVAGAGGAGAAGRGRPPADRARPRVRPGRRGLPRQAPAVGDHPGPGGPVRRERPGPAAPSDRDRPDRDGAAQRPARPGAAG